MRRPVVIVMRFPRIAFLVGLAASLLALAAPAWAQFANCAPRDVFPTRLAQIYDEKPVSLGVTSRGELLVH